MNRRTGVVSEFGFRITLTIGALSVSLVVLILFLYFFLSSGKTDEERKNIRDDMFLIVTTLGIASGVTGAFYAADTISRNSQTNKVNRAISVISEWNSKDLQDYKDVLDEIRKDTKNLTGKEKEDKIHEIIDSNPGYKGRVIGYLNFLEYVSLLVESDYVDEPMMSEYFCVIFQKAEDLLGLWIRSRQRESKTSKVYSSFVGLSKKWADGNVANIGI